MSDAADFSWMRLIFAMITVAGMLGALGWILKYVGMNGMSLPGKGAYRRRMKIVEIMPIDTRRRLVIVNCDGREHLLLLGAGQDIVVESNLSPAPAPE